MIKQNKMIITENLYDAKKLLENYYSQKTKELTKELTSVEETKRIKNLLVSLNNRIDIKSYIQDLHEYIRILVQNFYYGDLIEPENNKKLFTANRINFQVYLFNSLELLHQLSNELQTVLGESSNILVNKLDEYSNKAIDENNKLLNLEKKSAEKISHNLTIMYDKSLKDFLNFIRIKRDGGAYIPTAYLNQFNLDKKKVKTTVKGVWQYLIPGGLIPARIKTLEELKNKYKKCNVLIINLYPINESDKYKYICYTDIIDKIYRSLLTESSEIRNKLWKRSADPFTLTINDHITTSSMSLDKIQSIIRDYKDIFEEKLLEGVKEGNNDLKRVVDIMNYNVDNKHEINIEYIANDAPFIVVSQINKNKFVIYSDRNGKIKFEQLSDVPLIRQIIRLSYLTRGKEWAQNCLHVFDPENKIKGNSDGLNKDIKKGNQFIINYHKITENSYKKLKEKVVKKKTINCEMTGDKIIDDETIKKCMEIINNELSNYEKCMINQIKNVNISPKILINIPTKINLNQGIANLIDTPQLYQTAVIDELISHKIQLMMLKSKYLPKLDGNGRLMFLAFINVLYKCIQNTLNNIYKLEFIA